MNTRLEEMGHVYCMKVERALLDLKWAVHAAAG